MSGKYIFSVMLLLMVSLSEALEVFIKVNGEFVPVPGDYRLIKSTAPLKKLSPSQRHKRSAANPLRPVVIDGVSHQVPLSKIFEMFISLETTEARRAAFSPNKTDSFGECRIFETISWPGNCYAISSDSQFSVCDSASRGLAEIKMQGCVERDSSSNLDAFFG
ncbi:uncharacterized protein [Watersipora subatra]|uniref:uncharacterized protein n=1 Tax=Watersipora subatra TaxID=2589382 RepID=UPI00355AE6C6